MINDIKQRLDIVDIISSRIPIVKKGKNWHACCPFHDEKNPSFTVNQEKQFYYCFGCGAGGDVFDFIMSYERIGFSGTKTKLAALAGVTLEPCEYVKPSIPKSVREELGIDLLIVKMEVDKMTYKDKQRLKLAKVRLKNYGINY